jgi:hypothetical protein
LLAHVNREYFPGIFVAFVQLYRFAVRYILMEQSYVPIFSSSWA